MARSVDDVRMLFEVLAGRLVPDVDASTLRVGIPVSAFFDDLAGDIGARYDEVLSALRAGVANHSHIELRGVEAAPIAIAGSLLPYVAGVLQEELERRPDDFQPETLRVLTLGASFGEDDRAEAEEQRRMVRAAFGTAFDEVDVIVTPTIPGPPAPADTQTVVLASGPSGPEIAYSRYNGPMNLAGVPALSVPVADDLSLTITAARDREDRVVAVGKALEDALDRAFVDRVT
jgi:Asp-tRNA(Asn)/Glu-tRNA(Gln) amidotransferase A subunit family amidase